MQRIGHFQLFISQLHEIRNINLHPVVIGIDGLITLLGQFYFIDFYPCVELCSPIGRIKFAGAVCPENPQNSINQNVW